MGRRRAAEKIQSIVASFPLDVCNGLQQYDDSLLM
jgi:hypothetical protein